MGSPRQPRRHHRKCLGKAGQMDVVEQSREYRRQNAAESGADALLVLLEDEIIRLRERVAIRDEEIERLRAHVET